jgi:hypothetical protein
LDFQALVEIYCVEPKMIEHVWPLVEPMLASAFERQRSDSTLAAIEYDLRHALQLLWIASNGAAIVAAATTELCLVPAGKICSITAAAGVNTRLWDQFMPMVERYARAEGCSSLRVSGRPGWKRVLRDFDEPWITLNKDLA